MKRRSNLAAVLFVTSLFVAPVGAAATAPARTMAVVVADSLRAAPSAAMAPAPAVPAVTPRDYMAEARAAYTSENRAYQRIRVTLNLLSPLLGVLAGLLLMFTGLSQRMRDVAFGRGRGRWARTLVFFALYSLAQFVLLFPLAWYQDFALEQRFGFSTQTFAAWFLDQCKSLAFQVVAVGVVPLLALAWRAVETSPRRWWLWLASGTLPVALASVLLQPLVFDPLFNKFTTLHDESLRQDILALGARADVPARNVYEVDMSTRTKKLNAYVSGFGASQRIVLWDTTLKGMSRDEILFVMGHEMGHYVLSHIWKGLAVAALLAFAAFWLVAALTHAMLARFGPGWGVREVSDLAALPLILAMLSLVNWGLSPVTNAMSRGIEHESDVFALELTHDNDAGARAFLKLAATNRSDPEPAQWVKLMLFTHPPLGERIRFALEYRPWEKGEPNRAFHEKARPPGAR